MNLIEPGHVHRFRDWIAQRLGLRFEDAKSSYLQHLLVQRMTQGKQTSAAYLGAIEADASESELQALISELTVPETYFFRHVEQFRAYADVALPAAQAARVPGTRLQVLSVGCASGEEPYSLAMWARDHGGWPVEVHALDINPAMLAKAIRGQYNAWALRETPSDVQQRWFHSVGGGNFELSSAIRSAVTFHRINLAQGHAEVWQEQRYDVIFCRNVLMYFTTDIAQEAVSRMTRALAPHGHLFLGHAETIRGLSAEYQLCHTNDTFYYQRLIPGAVRRAPHEQRKSSAEARFTEQPPQPSQSWTESIRQSSNRIQTLSESSGRSVAARALADDRQQPRLDVLLQRARELLKKELFADALKLLNDLPAGAEHNPEVMLLRAALLTHCGRLRDAEEVSARLLEMDLRNAGAHYLLALCRESAGDMQGALEHDEAAISLDADFAMPRLHLGLMARRGGDWVAARSALGEAMPLLKREDAARLLLFGGGFGRDGLIALCHAELQAAGNRAAAS